MKLTNRWNRFIYRLWAPVYDLIFDLPYRQGRHLSMAALAIRPGERALFVGIGTGLDLPDLQVGIVAVGLDLSRPMLARAQSKLPLPGRAVSLVQGDAQALPFRDGVFDAAVLNLIVSVAPDGARCFRESMRVVRRGGRASVFDKFLAPGQSPGRLRRLLSVFTTLAGTDFNRRFEDIAPPGGYVIVRDEASLLRGMYRVILLRRL
ncbi:MAG: methyltransferase domain-containing protein [Anaerolineae bacterium]